MVTLHLLVEDDYVEDFVNSLDKDKVKIVEEDFKSNIEVIGETLKEYKSNPENFVPYYSSMKEMSIWLKEKEA